MPPLDYFWVMLVMLALLIFLINGFIFLACIIDARAMRVPGNVFLVRLMLMADLGIGLVSLPGFALAAKFPHSWPLPVWTCDLWITLENLCFNVSQLAVMMIALDRFLAVCSVLFHRKFMHPANQKRICVLVWLITLLRIILVFPTWVYISGYRRNQFKNQSQEYSLLLPLNASCTHPLFESDCSYGIMNRALSIYIPMMLLLFFYFCIFCIILRTVARPQTLSSMRPKVKKACSAPVLYPQPEHPCKKNKISATIPKLATASSVRLSERRRHPMRFRRTRRSLRQLTIIVIVFLATNLPWHVVANSSCLNRYTVSQLLPMLQLTWFITVLNALINPFCYVLDHRQYRQIIVGAVQRMLCLSTSRPPPYTLASKRISTPVLTTNKNGPYSVSRIDHLTVRPDPEGQLESISRKELSSY
ncbi:5-hydroxytryptamine receptor 1D [Cichlidogyrus casuarinus]|uniref:5-hydroxytryptamine receptor 1D n=1 Tax=Cichlidogyrus casuarinus TaxID=1844966 RepID=A0ABD2PUE1_9PLAT